MSDYGLVLVGHGSRDPDGLQQFEALAALMHERAGSHTITHGYLEFATPTIDQAVRANIALGAKEIVLVPGVLLAASHAKNDIPAEFLAMTREYPDVTFHCAGVMGIHPLLLELCRERLIAAESHSANVVRRDETCLVVVGRGTTDPDANSDVSKLSRMLEEGLGFGGSFVCYSGTAKPLVVEGLRLAGKLGFRRVIVFPYFLFDGVLVKRVNAAADALAERHPGLEVLKAGHLGVHPLVAEVFLARAQEAREGRSHMNCSLCKYRIQIVGFEEQVGQPQSGHHGRVRGLLARGNGPLRKIWKPYQPHPIEAESFRIISSNRDWSAVPKEHLGVLQRLVHTSGTYDIVEDVFFSQGAVEAGVRALLLGRCIVTDVTMVQSGLKRALLDELEIETCCRVHEAETELLSRQADLTRSAAGIRRAWQKFGNDVILAIGDAPTAITETVRLIREHNWRPNLVIGLPVGFVGTTEAKEELRRTLQVPRITNRGTRGGSPWAAAAVNALLIEAKNRLAAGETEAV
jgi:precorrin-8X/cobalt-precorrin-8 methylmutase